MLNRLNIDNQALYPILLLFIFFIFSITGPVERKRLFGRLRGWNDGATTKSCIEKKSTR